MNITLGQYLPRHSFVHGLDARVKLFLMAASIGVCFQLATYLSLICFTTICLTITIAARIPLPRMWSGIRPFFWLFALTAVLHVFMTPGTDLPWLPHATYQGLHHGLVVGIQLVLAIWISTLLTLTTPPLAMVGALEWYLWPLKYLKVPIEEIALLVMLAIRFIPILFDETERIIKAQKARGVDWETGGLVLKVKSLIPVLIPLLHRVFRRSDDLAIALQLRGFEPGINRARRDTQQVRGEDLATLIGYSAILTLLMWFTV